MILELEDQITLTDPTPAQLSDALSSLRPSGNCFAILERQPGFYLQVLMESNGSYLLEYQQGSLERHYRASVDIEDVAEVIEAFASYLAQDDRWHQRYLWDRITLRPAQGPFGRLLSWLRARLPAGGR